MQNLVFVAGFKKSCVLTCCSYFAFLIISPVNFLKIWGIECIMSYIYISGVPETCIIWLNRTICLTAFNSRIGQCTQVRVFSLRFYKTSGKYAFFNWLGMIRVYDLCFKVKTQWGSPNNYPKTSLWMFRTTMRMLY